MNDSRDMRLVRKIDAYVKGTLSEEETDELWAELLQKPEYIDYLETELAVRELIRKQRAGDEEKTGTAATGKAVRSDKGIIAGRIPRQWAWTGAAAAIIVLVSAYLFWGTLQQPSSGPLALSSIETQTQMALPDVRRSAGDEQLAPGDSLLNAGYHALVSGNREEALRIFRDLADRRSGELAAARASLNIGILEYNAERYQEAAQAFTSTAENPESTDFLREKAYWFLGNAYLQLNRPADSRQALEQAETYEGIYLKPVRRMLDRLSAEE